MNLDLFKKTITIATLLSFTGLQVFAQEILSQSVELPTVQDQLVNAPNEVQSVMKTLSEKNEGKVFFNSSDQFEVLVQKAVEEFSQFSLSQKLEKLDSLENQLLDLQSRLNHAQRIVQNERVKYIISDAGYWTSLMVVLTSLVGLYFGTKVTKIEVDLSRVSQQTKKNIEKILAVQSARGILITTSLMALFTSVWTYSLFSTWSDAVGTRMEVSSDEVDMIKKTMKMVQRKITEMRSILTGIEITD